MQHSEEHASNFGIIRSFLYAIKHHRLFLGLVLGTWGLYFIRLFWKMMEVRPDGLYVGHQNVWSDWALHTSIANIFAFKTPEYWFAYHPLYAGGQMTYPFVTHFISGMMMRIGFSLPMSFILPSILSSILLLMGMYFLFYILLNSRWQSFLAISVFFLSAGLGFVGFFEDFFQNPNLDLIFSPIKEYSRDPNYGWYAGNVATGLLIPQRTFLLGLTMGVWSLLGLLVAILKDNWRIKKRRHVLLIAGLIAGLMPISHAHSFIVIVLISGLICLVNFKKWRLLLWYVVPAALLSSALYLKFIWGGIENDSFFQKLIGWETKHGFMGWILMWLKFWGVAIPVAVAGYISMIRSKKNITTLVFFGAMFLIFIFGNLFTFQPIRWDNTKLFWWAYLGFSGLSASLIGGLWNQKLRSSRFLAVSLCIVLTLTGAFELILLQRVDKHTFQITSVDDIELGLKIREETHPLDRFITAPQHNHFVMVWGLRPILMGFTAWAWNFGFDYQEREKDIKKMYLGDQDTELLLRKYNVSYVVIGPTEERDLMANEEFFSSRFPLAFQNKNYRIYDTNSLLP